MVSGSSTDTAASLADATKTLRRAASQTVTAGPHAGETLGSLDEDYLSRVSKRSPADNTLKAFSKVVTGLKELEESSSSPAPSAAQPSTLISAGAASDNTVFAPVRRRERTAVKTTGYTIDLRGSAAWLFQAFTSLLGMWWVKVLAFAVMMVFGVKPAAKIFAQLLGFSIRTVKELSKEIFMMFLRELDISTDLGQLQGDLLQDVAEQIGHALDKSDGQAININIAADKGSAWKLLDVITHSLSLVTGACVTILVTALQRLLRGPQTASPFQLP